MITPLEFEKQYHNLVVVLDDLSIMNVDVQNYRLRGSNAALHHDTAAAENMKDKILAHLNDEIKAESKLEKAETEAAGEDFIEAPLHLMAATMHQVFTKSMTDAKPWIARVHMGKGWPEDIALTLSLVARYKLYDKSLDVKLGVAKYCDDFIGLDCNGFVGNYARAIGSSLTANTYIGSFAPETKRRTKLEDVRANDVMVWPDFGHITIIDSIGPVAKAPDGKPIREARVVESTAFAGLGNHRDGLQNSAYAIRSVDAHKKFTIERPKGGGTNLVYIAPLGL
jgi:hypothetical protein